MNAIETMKSLTFGTELEYTGIKRERAAHEIRKVVGGIVRYAGTGYQTWEVVAEDGRIWKAMRDGSLGADGGCEVVTPILRWEDMETLQEVVRNLRHAGAKATRETSQHVHIGARNFSAAQVANLAKMFYKQEELILKAAGTWEHRLAHYTVRTDAAFIERLNATRTLNNLTLNQAWFGRENLNPHRPEPEQHLEDRHDRIQAFQRDHPRRRSQGPHHPGPGAGRESPERQVRLKQESPGIQRGDRQVRHAGVPPQPRPDRGRVQEQRMHLLKHLPGNAAWKNGQQAA